MVEKITIRSLQKMRRQDEKIACLTAYDACFACLLDEAGIEIILVGDSLGMVLHGEASTVKVSMEEMIYHSKITSAGIKRALLVSDMPFMSYTSPAQALGNAARLVREGNAEVVKLEGGNSLDAIHLLSSQGIAVCAHLGLTPQSTHKFGGYHVQGKDQKAANRIKQEALDIQEAGAIMLIIECVPASLAREITQSLQIPVIGIGAGKDCDGQILVLHDMLGISKQHHTFSKNFLTQANTVSSAVQQYIAAIKSETFPEPDNYFN